MTPIFVAVLQMFQDTSAAFIGVMRDEMVIAGWPSGDRTVLLANVRALLSRAPAEQVQGQGEK